MRTFALLLALALTGQALAAVAELNTPKTQAAYRQAVRQLEAGDLGGARASVLKVARGASGLHFCAPSNYLSANQTVLFPEGEVLRFFKEANGRVSFIELRQGRVLLSWQAQATPGERWWNGKTRAGCGKKPEIPADLTFFDQDNMPPGLQAGQISTRTNSKMVTFNASFDDLRLLGLEIQSFPVIPGEAVKRIRP